MGITDLKDDKDDLRILIIDRSLQVLEKIRSKIAIYGKPDIQIYQFNFSEKDPTAHADLCYSDIIGIVNQYNINVIVINYQIYSYSTDGISEIRSDLFSFFFKKDFFTRYRVKPEILSNFKKIVVHTFDTRLTRDEIYAKELVINEFIQKEAAYFVNLSHSFVQFDFSSNKWLENPTLLPIDNQRAKYYHDNFCQYLIKILAELSDPKGTLHSFSEQADAMEKITDLNRTNNRLIRNLEKAGEKEVIKKIAHYSDDLKSTVALSGFNIGHVTFISNIIGNQELHLLDIPYKDYYDLVNQWLEDTTNWTEIYKNAKGDFLDDQRIFFDYTVDGNRFTLLKFWSSNNNLAPEQTKKIKNFLPFLHSSIFYDKKKWQNGLVVEQEKKSTNQFSIKMFFLFGRLDNRSFSAVDKLKSHLNFSVWSCNKNNYDDSVIEQLASMVKRTYLFDVRDVVQATVTLSIMDHVQKTMQAQEQLKFVKAHKHTLRNFGYEQHLVNLKYALKLNNFAKANEILDLVEKLNLLRDITIDFIYRTDEPITRLLLYTSLVEKGFLYSEILKIIDGGESNGKQLSIDPEAEKHIANKFDPSEIISVFNLLVNLYSNALNNTPQIDGYKVELTIYENILLISFVTNNPLKDEFYDYLLGITDINPSDGQGLDLVRQSLRILNEYIKIDIRRTEKQNIITLKINSYEMPGN